jgi:hypothetical protein
MAEKLEFDLAVKNNQLDKALDSSAKKAFSLEGALETAIGVLGGGLAIKAFDSLIGGFDSLIAVGKEAIKGAAENEVAVNNLTNSLARAGLATDGVAKNLIAYSEGLENTTTLEAEAALGSLSLLASLTKLDSEGLKSATTAAADLATVLGIDLESATRLVAKGAEGNVEAFKRYGIEIKKGTTDSETFSNLLGELNGRFGGAAASQLNTYTGALNALGISYGKILDPVGEIITKNPIVIALFNEIKNSIGEAGKEVNGFVPGLQTLVKEGFIALSVSAQIALDALDGITIVLKVLYGTFQNLSGLIGQTLIAPFELLIDSVIFLGSKIPGIGDAFENLKNPLNGATEAMSKLASEGIQGIQNAADGNLFRDLSDGLDNFTVRTLDAAAAVELAAISAVKNNENRKNSENEVNEEIVKSRTEAGNALLIAQQQLANQETEARLAQEAVNLEIQGINDQTALQRIYDQKLAEAEVVYQGEVLKNKTILDEQTKLAANLAAADNLARAKIKAESDFKIAEAKRVAAEEKTVQAARITATSSFLALGEALAKDGSVVAKGLASANAIVQTYAGATQVLGDPLIPVLAKPALVAATIANGLANVARINGVKFANGGFIDGNNGATMGPDTTTAQVRSGEMILNANQQKTLFDSINGGNMGGSDIIIQVDGREIARAVRSQIQSGFVLS